MTFIFKTPGECRVVDSICLPAAAVASAARTRHTHTRARTHTTIRYIVTDRLTDEASQTASQRYEVGRYE